MPLRGLPVRCSEDKLQSSCTERRPLPRVLKSSEGYRSLVDTRPHRLRRQRASIKAMMGRMPRTSVRSSIFALAQGFSFRPARHELQHIRFRLNNPCPTGQGVASVTGLQRACDRRGWILTLVDTRTLGSKRERLQPVNRSMYTTPVVRLQYPCF